jgi:hypothetical protein
MNIEMIAKLSLAQRVLRGATSPFSLVRNLLGMFLGCLETMLAQNAF